VRILSSDERLRRAASFNEDAEKYDRARPTYPVELYDALWNLAELGPKPDIVEVGCGTGQASMDLVKRAGSLTCVEFGENMAAVARRKLGDYPNAQVVLGKFEEWDPRDRQYDLIFASSSWHWIEPNVRYEKAARVLRPGGSLAVVNSEHFYPEGFDPSYQLIQDVYGQVTGSRKEVKATPVPSDRVLDKSDLNHIEELNRTGAYDQVSIARILWSFEREVDAYIDLLGTYSDHWALEPHKRQQLFEGIRKVIEDSPTGTIRKHYLSTVRVARVAKGP
jgi:SAM-dependent methyltransferase